MNFRPIVSTPFGRTTNYWISKHQQQKQSDWAAKRNKQSNPSLVAISAIGQWLLDTRCGLAYVDRFGHIFHLFEYESRICFCAYHFALFTVGVRWFDRSGCRTVYTTIRLLATSSAHDQWQLNHCSTRFGTCSDRNHYHFIATSSPNTSPLTCASLSDLRNLTFTSDTSLDGATHTFNSDGQTKHDATCTAHITGNNCISLAVQRTHVGPSGILPIR